MKDGGEETIFQNGGDEGASIFYSQNTCSVNFSDFKITIFHGDMKGKPDEKEIGLNVKIRLNPEFSHFISSQRLLPIPPGGYIVSNGQGVMKGDLQIFYRRVAQSAGEAHAAPLQHGAGEFPGEGGFGGGEPGLV